jgi:hypothetical protein
MLGGNLHMVFLLGMLSVDGEARFMNVEGMCILRRCMDFKFYFDIVFL